MICFAAFVPNSPLLLSTIGKENTKSLEQTVQSMQRLSEELYASHPDVILTISSHPNAHPDIFSANLHQNYAIELREFGDLSDRGQFEPDVKLIADIQHHATLFQIPFNLDSDPFLDYGAGVPLSLLASFSKKPKLIPVSTAHQSPKMHVQFGRSLKDACVASKKRVAIIACGDLSHALRSDSPAGFHEAGARFDQQILQAVEQFSLSQLLSIDEETTHDAAESGSQSLYVLFGILEHISVRPELLSYEHPFGVGELVAQFHLTTV